MSASATSVGLVELLLSDCTAGPDDLDVITESTEQDGWCAAGPPPRPGDLDIETKSVEQDQWVVARGAEDLDVIAKSDGCAAGPPTRPTDLDTETAAQETDAWRAVPATAVSANGPKPSPRPSPRPGGLDIETFTSNEGDRWI